MNYTGNTKTAIACSFLENDKNGSATAMKVLLDDYKKLLVENTSLKQENNFLKATIEEMKTDQVLEYFLSGEKHYV